MLEHTLTDWSDKMRFTVDGSEKLEELISEQMKEIAKEALDVFSEGDLYSIVLGGGYGKGEGGVLTVDGKEKTFNDYDLFVITDNVSLSQKRIYHEKLEKISHKLTEKFGIDVDFAFPINFKGIRKLPFTQMWGELRHGYYTVAGKDGAVDSYQHTDLKNLPHSEAKKLLVNRGVGLKLAEDRLERVSELNDEDVDFISRNIFKAVLGLGDAYLIINGKFHHSYRKRSEIIEGIVDLSSEFKNIYAQAVDYKLHPRLDYSLEELKGLYRTVLKIFNEKISFFMFKEEKECYIKNFLLNIRNFGVRPDMKWYFKYPRERLFYSLPFFLSKNSHRSGNDVARALGLKGKGHKIELWNRFYIIWQVYN